MRIGNIELLDAFEAYYADDKDAYEVEEILDSKYNQINYPSKSKYKQSYTKDQDGKKDYYYKKPKYIKLPSNNPLDFATAKDLALNRFQSVDIDGNTVYYEGITQDVVDNEWTDAKKLVKWIEDNLSLYYIDDISNITT